MLCLGFSMIWYIMCLMNVSRALENLCMMGIKIFLSLRVRL